jgi:hypothetical protein
MACSDLLSDKALGQVKLGLDRYDAGDGFIATTVLQTILLGCGVYEPDCARMLAQLSKVRISEFMDWLGPSSEPNPVPPPVTTTHSIHNDIAPNSVSPQDVNKDKEQLGIERPQGMATKEQVTDGMRARQRRNPEQWTMSLQQFNDVIDFCKGSKQYWAIKAKKRYVDMNDINELFVKKWTEGTGCSVAVLMSQDAV